MSFALQVSAQDQTFRFGLKLSGNLAWIKPNSKNIENTGTGLGYSYGIMGDYHFQEFYALSTELLITQFSSGIEHTDSLTYAGKGYRGVTYDYNFQYLQIPVSLKFKTKEIGYITYWAQFGLAPSFLMSAKADLGGNLPANIAGDNPTDVQVNDKESDKYHFENFDDKVFFARLPLIIGGGIEYRLAGNASLYAGVRVDNSFTNIFVADDLTSGRNNFVSFSTGVFF
jgi:hypothetical protein